ncbi:YaaR family protein [Paraliobacillus salinarum]|uniref:YaaR family protein n=1 Tax=Paraliobacillus salinarum TaxID=1158996 RepID=UPI0015F43BB1|nr:YaaR family protein [Paraliobacillus salinarum]
MKINQEMRAQLEATKTQVVNNQKSSKKFDVMVASQTQKLQHEQLTELVKNITLQGERLARFRSFKDLAKYKRLVKDFVKEAVQYGMDLNHSHSFNFQGNNRKLTLVKEIDEKLVQLTEVVLEQERRSIDILDVIGEIKGLLINLYS